MAIVTLSEFIPSYQWWADYFEPADTNLITSRTSTSLVWEFPDGTTVTLTGTDFDYDEDDRAIDGIVSTITVRDGSNNVLMTFTKVNTELAVLYDRAFGETLDFTTINPNGFDFLSQVLNRADTIYGSDSGDDLVGGRNGGNDIIYARGGNDFVKGDQGNDTIVGGAGFDTLSYMETFFDSSAFRGIRVDAATRTVIDSWGNVDKYSQIEVIEGSRFRDVFLGGSGNDIFTGLKGADSFKGGAGFDSVFYDRDDDFGGTGTISVDLVAGTVVDGWGNVDRLTSIEYISGTVGNDTFLGNGAGNVFSGGDGIDSLNGGGGSDTADFGFWDVTSGAVVDLSTGVVSDDGYGNAEILANIENVTGTKLLDILTGSSGDNILRGMEGDDELYSTAGVDQYDGGNGIDFIDFLEVAVTQGVRVNLATNTITNDGHGNTESLFNVENVNGSNLGDVLRGDGQANRLAGFGGVDTLVGGAGSDTITGDGGTDLLTGGSGEDVFRFRSTGETPWGDTITDFTSGSDTIFLGVRDGMSLSDDFNVSGVSGTGAQFYFDSATSSLYWDGDGANGGAAILLVTLAGVTSVVSEDLELF